MALKRATYVGIALLSAATLLFELALMRLFALVQWHHMAFLGVSVALLGYAASGTALLMLGEHGRRAWLWAAVALPPGLVGAYLLINT
ncbi:MAG: SAM-dependent methyltransferase, partial [Chloroflexota bacterium]